MARDYAKQNSHGKGRRRSHTGGGIPGWLGGLIGLSFGLALAAGVYIVMRPAAPVGGEPAPAPTAKAPQPKVTAESPDIPPPQEARFKFYDLLPKYEVKPSEEAYRPQSSDKAAASSSARYLIQAGSFIERADAERRRANLALIGFEASIREVKVEGKGLRYRVQIGPPMDYQQAEKTMRRLADNDIDSFATRAAS